MENKTGPIQNSMIQGTTSEDANVQVPPQINDQKSVETQTLSSSQSQPQLPPTNTPLSQSLQSSEPINPSSVVTIERRKGAGLSSFLIPLLVVVMLGVWAWVGYIFFQNKQITDEPANNITNVMDQITQTPKETLFDPETIRISQGNIVIDSFGEGSKTLIEKSNYKGSGIIGFTKVEVSPNFSNMCFESIPPAVTPELYVSDVEAKVIKKVGAYLKNCTWSSDSKTLYYLKYLNASPRTDIYAYDIETEKSLSLTDSEQTISGRTYNLLGLSADGSSIICTYTDGGSETISNCEINTNSFIIRNLD